MFCWTVHLNGGPRGSYAAVTVEHEVYYFGMDYDNYNDHIDVHVFNTVSLSWRKLSPVTVGGEECPSKGYGHTAVLIEDTIYIWGGWPCWNVLHAFDVKTQTWFKPKVSGTVPKGRCYHSACVLGKVMFIYGGSQGHTIRNDIYKLDTTTMVWSLIKPVGTRALVSTYHSATIIGTKMLVFGGKGSMWGQNNSIRVFDTETNTWMNPPSIGLQHLPRGRCGHAAFTYNGELYILGGENLGQTLDDLWKFNPETFSWTKVELKGKGPRAISKMCCCSLGDCVVLFFFGGSDTPRDLYTLDLSPSLQTLCKLAVIQYDQDQSELPHNIRWELAAMKPTATEEKERKKDSPLKEQCW